MKEWWSYWYNKYGVLILIACISLALHEWVDWEKIDASAWAAWVQAVGSVIAILIAVAVPYMQNIASQKRDRDLETEAIYSDLQSIKDELSVSLEGMGRTMGPSFDAMPQNGTYNYMFRPDKQANLVYQAIVDRIGRIPHHDLRRRIVRTYALLESLMGDFHTHADLVGEYRQTVERLNTGAATPFAMSESNAARGRLVTFSGLLKNSYNETVQEIEATIDSIAEALINYP